MQSTTHATWMSRRKSGRGPTTVVRIPQLACSGALERIVRLYASNIEPYMLRNINKVSRNRDQPATGGTTVECERLNDRAWISINLRHLIYCVGIVLVNVDDVRGEAAVGCGAKRHGSGPA